MRLIDADEMQKFLIEQAKAYTWLLNCYNLEWISNFIEARPTVEAEPVKHACWKTNVYASQVVVCSFCNNTSLLPTTYCGNCGAKMDEEAEE